MIQYIVYHYIYIYHRHTSSGILFTFHYIYIYHRPTSIMIRQFDIVHYIYIYHRPTSIMIRQWDIVYSPHKLIRQWDIVYFSLYIQYHRHSIMIRQWDIVTFHYIYIYHRHTSIMIHSGIYFSLCRHTSIMIRQWDIVYFSLYIHISSPHKYNDSTVGYCLLFIIYTYNSGILFTFHYIYIYHRHTSIMIRQWDIVYFSLYIHISSPHKPTVGYCLLFIIYTYIIATQV